MLPVKSRNEVGVSHTPSTASDIIFTQFCHLTSDAPSNFMRSPNFLTRIFLRLAQGLLGGGILAVSGILLYLIPSLPPAEQIRQVQLQTPLKVYASGGELIGEFGEQRRRPITYDQIPQHFVHAILSAEDDGFFDHRGVDIKGLLRAALELAQTGSIQSGGSTITMQVARNFFLSIEQTFTRKFNEILLALQIEHELSKEEILELYANKIYLGRRAYGIQSAANVYYGKDISELSVAQLAMIAGLPKAPSASNPLSDPERALIRRNWILGRMQLLGYLSQEEYELAVAEVDNASDYGVTLEFDGTYVAEMARIEMFRMFGQSAYEAGYLVYTTVDANLQRAADSAVRAGVANYDARHGYRGAEARVGEDVLTDNERLTAYLNGVPRISGMEPAVVTALEDRTATLQVRGVGEVVLEWQDGLAGTRRYRTHSWQSEAATQASDLLAVGDRVRVIQRDERWNLTQIPTVQAGMVALDPLDGGIVALTGGYDFYQSNFNRMTSANRQPGSSIKPFLYAAALEHGHTAATLINDAPLVFEDAGLEDIWRPENDSGLFYGPTRLREALYRSRNLVSVRILRNIGIDAARRTMMAYGFADSELPYNLTLALGSQGLPPIRMAAANAVLANGGYRVEPHLIREVWDSNGNLIYRASPLAVCDDCENPAPRVMDERIVFIIDSILKDVVLKGTATRALQLGRADIGGKTGTTNGPRDAWFVGYSPHMVGASWVGFDDNGVLGSGEFGGSAALPVWIEFMRVALEGKPQVMPKQPDGVVSVRIDPQTGERAAGNTDGIFEWFLTESSPAERSGESFRASEVLDSITEDLF